MQLLPVPRKLEFAGGELRLPDPTRVAGVGAPALERVRQSLERAGVRTTQVGGRADVELRELRGLRPEEYRLTVGADGITLDGTDARGLLWAAQTLDQILAQRGAAVPRLRIEDWPDFPLRAYMLDISRDRVPTNAWLRELALLLSRLRINQLQLYTEHTFAYREHEQVWRDASPLTPEDVRALDAWCASLGVELVPNQNSFGHMERWLRHGRYTRLAELAEPGERPRTCLTPGPESLRFARELYAELLPCFASRSVNIGCDETAELGQGRSRDACARRGRGRVYLDHVLALARGLQEQGYTVQFWSDMIGQEPDLIRRLPRQGLVALAWGYEAPRDPAAVPAAVLERLARLGIDPDNLLAGFETRVRPLAEAGVPYFVCPGTSSWNSLIGRWPNARANLRDAADVGLAQGAAGYLITDWGDNGHLQPPTISLPGLAYGAALAWCTETARDADLAAALPLLLDPPDRACAAPLLELGSLGAATGLDSLNSSPLSHALLRPLDARLPCWGDPDPTRLAGVADALATTRATLLDAPPTPTRRELAQATALAHHATQRLQLRAGNGPAPATLREDLQALIEEQAATWHLRSRPGGLDDSLSRLRARLDDYDD